MDEAELSAERSRLVDLLGWYDNGDFGDFNSAAAERAWALRLRLAEIDQKLGEDG